MGFFFFNWVLSSNSEQKKLESSITTTTPALCLISGFRSRDGKAGKSMRFAFDRRFACAPLRALFHSDSQPAGHRPVYRDALPSAPFQPRPSLPHDLKLRPRDFTTWRSFYNMLLLYIYLHNENAARWLKSAWCKEGHWPGEIVRWRQFHPWSHVFLGFL